MTQCFVSVPDSLRETFLLATACVKTLLWWKIDSIRIYILFFFLVYLLALHPTVSSLSFNSLQGVNNNNKACVAWRRLWTAFTFCTEKFLGLAALTLRLWPWSELCTRPAEQLSCWGTAARWLGSISCRGWCPAGGWPRDTGTGLLFMVRDDNSRLALQIYQKIFQHEEKCKLLSKWWNQKINILTLFKVLKSP